MFLPNLLIALREGLEASLVVGILVAYLVRSDRRDVLPRLWAGVVLAAIVPLAVGAILTWGPKTLTFQAQEILGGSLSLVAVALTTSMIFWMSKNARALKQKLESGLEKALRDGRGWGVVLIAAVAVGREGVETALILWATVKSSVASSTWVTTAGILTGFAVAIVLGVLIYRGALRLNLGTFFTWTGLFLVVVAAGVLAYGVGDLQEAGVIPGWGQAAFNLSAVVPPTSWYGTVLGGLFNFTPAPTWAQFIAWLLYLVVTLVCFVRVSGLGRRRPTTVTNRVATNG